MAKSQEACLGVDADLAAHEGSRFFPCVCSPPFYFPLPQRDPARWNGIPLAALVCRVHGGRAYARGMEPHAHPEGYCGLHRTLDRMLAMGGGIRTAVSPTLTWWSNQALYKCRATWLTPRTWVCHLRKHELTSRSTLGVLLRQRSSCNDARSSLGRRAVEILLAWAAWLLQGRGPVPRWTGCFGSVVVVERRRACASGLEVRSGAKVWCHRDEAGACGGGGSAS